MAQDAHYHNAPPSTMRQKNPLAGQHAAVVAGAKLYAANCSACHGATGQGSGNIPSLSHGPTQSVPDGEVFWFITTSSVGNGKRAWGSRPREQPREIVSSLDSPKTTAQPSKTRAPTRKFTSLTTNAPPSQHPFTELR